MITALTDAQRYPDQSPREILMRRPGKRLIPFRLIEITCSPRLYFAVKLRPGSACVRMKRWPLVARAQAMPWATRPSSRVLCQARVRSTAGGTSIGGGILAPAGMPPAMKFIERAQISEPDVRANRFGAVCHSRGCGAGPMCGSGVRLPCGTELVTASRPPAARWCLC